MTGVQTSHNRYQQKHYNQVEDNFYTDYPDKHRTRIMQLRGKGVIIETYTLTAEGKVRHLHFISEV